jgi:hypothetical protein
MITFYIVLKFLSIEDLLILRNGFPKNLSEVQIKKYRMITKETCRRITKENSEQNTLS